MASRFSLRDPFGIRAAREGLASERASLEGDRLLMVAEARAEAMDWIRLHPEEWAQRVAETHTTEMSWRARQNFYDVTGKTGVSTIDEQTRRKHVERSRLHYVNNPTYVRAINLTADFIFGKGVSAPRLASQYEPGEGKELPDDARDAQRVFGLVDELWHDPMNLRSMSGTEAQIERCKQLLIDGEVPWLLFVPGAGEAGYRWWPSDSLRWQDCIEHPKMAGVPLLYRRATGNVSEWFWSTDAYALLDNPESVRAELLKAGGQHLNDRAWTESRLDEKFTAGPFVLMWSWKSQPMALRGHPPFFSALDWGEVNTGLAGNLQTYIKSVTALTWKMRGRFTAGDISDKKAALASKLSGNPQPPGTGTAAIMGEGTDLSVMDVPTGGAELFKTGFEVSRLMQAAATGIPVHWLGDPSTGNLATATAMELPQLKMFEGWQRWFTGQYDEMFRVVARHSTGTEYDTAEAIEIDFPELVSRDAFQMLQAIATAKSAGIISDEDAARQAARQFGEDDVDAFVERVTSEPDEAATQLAGLFESNPREGVRFLRRVESKLRGE